MINHEGTVGIRAGKHLADEAVCMLYPPDECVVTFHVGVSLALSMAQSAFRIFPAMIWALMVEFQMWGSTPPGVRMAFVYMPVFYDDVHGYRPE